MGIKVGRLNRNKYRHDARMRDVRKRYPKLIPKEPAKTRFIYW